MANYRLISNLVETVASLHFCVLTLAYGATHTGDVVAKTPSVLKTSDKTNLFCLNTHKDCDKCIFPYLFIYLLLAP